MNTESIRAWCIKVLNIIVVTIKSLCIKTYNVVVEAIRALCIKALILRGRRSVKKLHDNAADADKVNEQLLMNILRKNSDTEYGKKYGFSDIHSIEEYRNKVPFSNYETYVPYIDRIFNTDEKNVLTAAKVIGFSRSSGSIGRPKITPVTNSAISVYTRYTVTRFLALAEELYRKNGKKVKYARGICALPRFEELSPCGLPCTNVADVAAKKYGFVYPLILNLPLKRQFLFDEIENKYAETRFGLEDRDTMYMFSVFSKTIAEIIEYIRDNWQLLVKDIEEGTIDSSVQIKPEVRAKLMRSIKPNPERAAELRREFEKGFDETIISRIWPNMIVISTIGTSKVFERFTNIVLQHTKGIALDYSIYGASEGLFAAAYKCNDMGLVMLPDSCFYEFIEQNDELTEPPVLTLGQLEVGKTYEIIITNQMGLYRFRFNDIIRVLGYEGKCPIINFEYRKGQLLNITGEKTDFAQMSEAVKRLERTADTRIKNWCVFVDRGVEKYRYGILLETCDGRDLSGYSEEFEQLLRDVNTSYLYYEGKDLIEPPKIYMQKPGSHEEWKQMKCSMGASPEQVKPVNILDTEEKKEFFLSRIEEVCTHNQ